MKELIGNTRVLVIALMHLMLFGLAALGKIATPSAVLGYFHKIFDPTFIAPLVEVSFWGIVALQCVIALVLLVSLVKLEFRPGANKDWLIAGLILGMLCFIVLIFGQLVAHQNTPALQTFIAFGVSAFCLFYVEKVASDQT